MSAIATSERGAAAGETAVVALGALAAAGAAAALAGLAPVWLSIATVFLFAGPHNWIEARYFLARLPGRWGRSRTFFALSIGGAFTLAAAYVAVPSLARGMALEDNGWSIAVASWNTAVVLWVVAVCHVHARQTGRDWGWTLPVGLALVAATWAAPFVWSLGLVYVHPLVSLAFLDRELRRRPSWRAGYRIFLACLPIVVAVLWASLAGAPPIAGDEGLTLRIVEHAGAGLVPGVSSRLLVATHVFLENIHYAVWLVAMPFVGFRSRPWRFDGIPLGRRSAAWSASVRLALLCGAAAVTVLWVCFVADYTTTRDVYFTIAVAHVLVEAPFLVRTL
jgi:hypothetical protein